MHLSGVFYWCGPGTKVEKRPARNDPGINKLDEACEEHDIFYSKEKDLTRRHEAEKVLGSKAFARFKASDDNWKKKLAAIGVAGTMKAKVKLGMGLRATKKKNQSLSNTTSSTTTIRSHIQKIQQGLGSSLKHTKEIMGMLNSISNETRENQQKAQPPPPKRR